MTNAIMTDIPLVEKELYGFLETLEPEQHDMAIEHLTETTDMIPECLEYVRTRKDIVEEIIKRDGKFYTGPEAIENGIPRYKGDNGHRGFFLASYKHRDGDILPANPAYRETDWGVISIVQYYYGKYLLDQISKNNLKIEDLQPTVYVEVKAKKKWWKFW